MHMDKHQLIEYNSVKTFYPRGSLLVNVRLRLGLAWLMGIVLPCNKEPCVPVML